MTDNLDRLTQIVRSKLRILGYRTPTRSVLHRLLEIAFVASIKTEENRFIRGSLTYSDPVAPEIDPPICRRADYPSFTPFGHRTPLDVNTLVKLSRAVDMWSGSITIYDTTKSGLFIWGMVDQQVHKNIRLNQEANVGYTAPGIVTINIDGVGEVSVYHGDVFLGRLRQNQLIMSENDVLHSDFIAYRVIPALEPFAKSIARVLDDEQESILGLLLDQWATTIARICIGLRRLGTGGSLLITPTPIMNMLDIIHPFRYRRLGDSTILNVLDDEYYSKVEWNEDDSLENARERSLAEADAEDRAEELTGAVKVVTSLAAADGLVLMDLTLGVVGFGVKITTSGRIGTVFNGLEFVRKGTKARKIDPSHFGTRHGSMLRYCQADRKAIGIVVSQDGHTRLIASTGRNLTFWDNVKLLGYRHDVRTYAKYIRGWRLRRSKVRERRTLGFTAMPKTIHALLSRGKK